MAAKVAGQSGEGQDSNTNKILPSAQSVQSIAGLAAVVIGVLAITALAISTIAFIHSGKDAMNMIPLSTSAFARVVDVAGRDHRVLVVEEAREIRGAELGEPPVPPPGS